MLRTDRCHLALLVGLAATVALPRAATAGGESEENGFVRIFNGEDLSGWEGKEGAWTVRDGAITSTGFDEKNWLIWRGGKLRDFVLRLKFRFVEGNSGVQVRSKEIRPFTVRGYQVEVASHDEMGLWHHSLAPAGYRSHLATAGQKVRIRPDGEKLTERFARAEKVQKVCKDGEWNRMTVIGKGPKLVQKINGVVFAKLVDKDRKHSSRSGLLALQDHGGGTTVQFKDIRVKHLGEGEER